MRRIVLIGVVTRLTVEYQMQTDIPVEIVDFPLQLVAQSPCREEDDARLHVQVFLARLDEIFDAGRGVVLQLEKDVVCETHGDGSGFGGDAE